MQRAYERTTEEWSRTFLAAQETAGRAAVDEARPYHSGIEELESRRGLVREAARDFKLAADKLAKAKRSLAQLERCLTPPLSDAALQELNAVDATVAALAADRGRCEMVVSERMREYRDLERTLEEWRKAHLPAVERSLPVFAVQRKFAGGAADLLARRVKLRAAVRGAKRGYSDALRDLEALSLAVHERRLSGGVTPK